MVGTDPMLALIARNHDLLRLARETRERALEAIEAAERAMEAAEAAMEAAELAREMAERATLITVHRAVLCAAAAGGWEAVQPGREVIKRILLTDLR